MPRTCCRRSCGRSVVPTEVRLPRLGQGMESGTIVKWLKAEGEAVEKGEPLYELDTDKVTQEGEAEVGRTIGFIGAEGEAVQEAAEAAPEPKTEEPKETPKPVVRQQSAAPTSNGRIKASPLARRLARERGVDLASLRGSGPEGRIVAQDVESPAPAAARPAAPVASVEVQSQPLSNIRKTIARRLTEAWTVPAFMLTVSADMT